MEAAACGLLLSAIAGAVVSLCGVTGGWATGRVDDIKWGPYGPSMSLTVDLGWWNNTSVMKSHETPAVTEMTGDSGQQTLGVFMAVTYVLASGLALYFVYLLAAKPCGREVELMTPPDLSKTLQFMTYATATSGVAVLLFAIIMYMSLAIGAHKAVKEKTAQFGLEADMWAHPSWAFVGAAASGGCLLGAARMLQVALTEAAGGYRPFRTSSFSFE